MPNRIKRVCAIIVQGCGNLKTILPKKSFLNINPRVLCQNLVAYCVLQRSDLRVGAIFPLSVTNCMSIVFFVLLRTVLKNTKSKNKRKGVKKESPLKCFLFVLSVFAAFYFTPRRPCLCARTSGTTWVKQYS